MPESESSITDLTQAAKTVEADPNFRVLRKLVPIASYEDLSAEPQRSGLALDVETSGLNPAKDSIIEIAVIQFQYGVSTGAIGKVRTPVSFLEDPGKPLDPEIITLTGITDQMLNGKTIDDAVVQSLFANADLVVAHNAGFDRPFVDRRFPFAAGMPWACSLMEIPWDSYGHSCQKLGCLLENHGGAFFDAHRATSDALALVHVLASKSESGDRPMKALLEYSRGTTVRIAAVDAPFDAKDDLKARGYRWNPGGALTPKAWWCEIPQASKDAELDWLTEEVYGGRTGLWQLVELDATSRYAE